MDKLIISDTHYHNFERFSKINTDGVNSRLQDIIDATKFAVKEAKLRGITQVRHAGDCFHVRGKISPTVLNPVLELYRWIVEDMEMEVVMIAGNHDLESRDANDLSNTASALKSVGVEVINEILVNEDTKEVFIPWIPSVSELMTKLKEISGRDSAAELDVFIHAPMDGVIKGLPENGLKPNDLNKFGFRNIFCGHYHNHKSFGNVHSIGALTHQNFGDIDSLAGFVIAHDDGTITHMSTKAPKFVDLEDADVTSATELEEHVRGNYARAKMEEVSEKDISIMRQELSDAGVLDVVIMHTAKPSTATARATSSLATGKSVKIEKSISNWIIERGFGDKEADVEKSALSILGEIQ